jgi:hypothetical protein
LVYHGKSEDEMYDLCHGGKNKNKLSPISPSMDGL